MNTILILSVGGTPDPIVHAIEQQHPDFVYFICSGGDSKSSTETIIQNIIDRTATTCDTSEIFKLKNPDDFNEVLITCEKIEASITNNFSNNPKIIANYTGGTKTMSLGLGAYALRRSPAWELQANVANRVNTIKIERGGVAQRLDLSTYHFQDLHFELEQLGKKYLYESALERLNWLQNKFALNQDHQNELFQLRQYYQSLAYADRFEYEEAYLDADQCEKMKNREKPRFKLLRKITQLMKPGNKESWPSQGVSGHELVVDIIENAKRCVYKKKFDDAIGRLYRSTELLAQIKLLRDHKIHTSDVKAENIQLSNNDKKWLLNKENYKGIIQIGLMDSYSLLSRIKDPLGKYWDKNKDNLRSFIEQRNQSFFAHGMTPITKDCWFKVGDKWIEWLNAAIETVKQ